MGKLLSTILIVFTMHLAFGQYDSKGDENISRFRPGFMWFFTGYKPAKTEKVRKYDRLIFDLTYNDWIGDRDLFKNHWASIGLNTNLMFDIPLTKGNTVALGLGVAYQYSVIRHNGNLTINDSLGSTTWSEKLPSQTFQRSVLGAHSFSIPIELRFRTESWRHFKFHIGGKIGYQPFLYSKTVTKANGIRMIDKNVGFPDENQLIYSAHIRFGLRNIAFFGSYNFNRIFSSDQSVRLNHVQMGLSFSLF